MYANLAIKRFRGLRDVRVDRLARVNLLIGNNGTGKTTFLEALWLHSNPNADLVGRVDAFRSYAWDVPIAGLAPTSAPWRYLFYATRMDEAAEICGEVSGHRWTLVLRPDTAPSQIIPAAAVAGPARPDPSAAVAINTALLNPVNTSQSSRLVLEVIDHTGADHGPFKVGTITSAAQGVATTTMRIDGTPQLLGGLPELPRVFVTLLTSTLRSTAEIVLRYGIVEREKKQDRVIRTAQLIEPRVTRLAVIPRFAGDLTLYADTGGDELIPVQLMGEGFQNVVTFAIATAVTGNGVVLIDEIENGVYYAALEPLWRALHNLCEEMDTQIIATTHSLECVEAARRAIPKDDLLVHRLSRLPESNDIVVHTLDAEMLEAARHMDLEVR